VKRSELEQIIKKETERLLQEVEVISAIDEEIQLLEEEAKSEEKAQVAQLILMATYIYAEAEVIGKESKQKPVTTFSKQIEQVGSKIKSIDTPAIFDGPKTAELSDGTQVDRDVVRSVGSNGQKILQKDVLNMSEKNDMFKKIEKVQNHLYLARGGSSLVSKVDPEIASIMKLFKSGEMTLSPGKKKAALSLDVLADSIIDSKTETEETSASSKKPDQAGESTGQIMLVTTVKYITGSGISKPNLPDALSHHQKYMKLWLRPELSEEMINSLYAARKQIQKLDSKIKQIDRKLTELDRDTDLEKLGLEDSPEIMYNRRGSDNESIYFRHFSLPGEDAYSGYGENTSDKELDGSYGSEKGYTSYLKISIPLANFPFPEYLRRIIEQLKVMVKKTREDIKPSKIYVAANYLTPAGRRRIRGRRKLGNQLIKLYQRAIELAQQLYGQTSAFYKTVNQVSKKISYGEIKSRIKNPENIQDQKLYYIAYGATPGSRNRRFAAIKAARDRAM
jgi:hypothetical protein